MGYKNDILKAVNAFHEDVLIAEISLQYLKSKGKVFDAFIKHCQSCAKILNFPFPIYSCFLNEVLNKIVAQKCVQKKDIDLLKYILESVISDIDKVIKPEKFFISHSIKDCTVVDNFVDLLVQVGLKKDICFVVLQMDLVFHKVVEIFMIT